MKAANTKSLTGLLGDIRRQNNFILTINDVTGEGNSLDLVVQQAFLPKVSLNVIELRHGNTTLKLAGAAVWEGGTVTILDVLSRKELDAVIKWFKEGFDDEARQVGFADSIKGTDITGYKKSGYITEYAGDGRFERKWTLEGMWVSSLDLGVLDAAVAEGKRISFTVQIDPSPIAPEYGADYEVIDSTIKTVELK